MRIKSLVKLIIFTGTLLSPVIFPDLAQAALSFGSGYYTNLCESGTSAAYYNCNSGCNPSMGSCQGDNDGVVRWICQGKWNQCLESESQWSGYEKLEGMSCGYTVQLSLFDKKCRRVDGSWDNTCRLLGYMTWYSGDCYEGQTVTPGPTVSVVSPSSTVIPTVTPAVTVVPSPTVAVSKISSPSPTKPLPTPTSVPVSGMCGKTCKLASDCKIGFACVGGYCRNPACPTDKECFCRSGEVSTPSAVLKKTPETGVETWLGMAAMVGLGVAGMKLRKLAKRVW